MISGTVALSSNWHTGMEDCQNYCHSVMGSYCVGNQAATNPWRIDDGTDWAESKGYDYIYSHSWDMSTVSNSPWKKRDTELKIGMYRQF